MLLKLKVYLAWEMAFSESVMKGVSSMSGQSERATGCMAWILIPSADSSPS
jgi:hypothetical protein